MWGKRERAPSPQTGPSLVLQLDLQRVSFFLNLSLPANLGMDCSTYPTKLNGLGEDQTRKYLAKCFLIFKLQCGWTVLLG